MLRKLRTQHLTLTLSLALLIKSSRAFSQEDWGGYRHEFYREDEDRMKIDTDSLAFDIGLMPNVRVNGEFVIDAISGATPTGAPPQTQWNFPTFTTFYNQSFNQMLQNELANNIILLEAGLYPDFPTYSNAIYAANLAANGFNATNSANQSLQALTNSPSFHKSTVPLTLLHDLRRAFNLNMPITLGISQLTPGFAVSKESDYHSYGVSLDYQLGLNKKNTILDFGWSHDSDRVRDDVLVWEGKVTDDFLIGVTQLLTPKSYITVDFTYANEYGYLSDPYRGVMTFLPDPQLDPEDAALIPENRPRKRRSEIFYTSYNQFIDPLYGSVEFDYRFFHDSYGIFAHTIELDWHQKIGKYVVFTPGFRYYNQTAAAFYGVIFADANNLPAFYSSDYRLSDMQAITASAAVTCRIHKHVSLDISYMRYIMQGLDGVTSQSAYPAANVLSLGGRIWF